MAKTFEINFWIFKVQALTIWSIFSHISFENTQKLRSAKYILAFKCPDNS